MDRYQEKVIRIADYIETHIHREINLEEISSEFHVSKFHLHRIFGNLAGQPLISYIRGRKMARSLKDLKEGNGKIIDIALKYGFSYEQSYIRTFKSAYEITPHQYRKSSRILKITPKITPENLALVGDGLLMPPQHLYLPEKNLIGMPTTLILGGSDFLNKPNSAGTQFVLEESRKIEGEFDSTVYYSLIRYLDRDNGVFEYTPSFVFETLKSCPPTLKELLLPGGEYITFKYFGHHSPFDINMKTLAQCYQHIEENYSSFIIENCDLSYKLERIDNALCSDDYCELDLFYKIR